MRRETLLKLEELLAWTSKELRGESPFRPSRLIGCPMVRVECERAIEELQDELTKSDLD